MLSIKHFLKNKIFIGITLAAMLVVALLLFSPRIGALISEEHAETENGEHEEFVTEKIGTLLLKSEAQLSEETLQTLFETAFPEYYVVLSDDETAVIKEKIKNEDADCAFVLHTATDFTYYVNDLLMFDMNSAVASEVLQEFVRLDFLVQNGVSPEDAQSALNVTITSTTETLGKSQEENFFYTYIMIIALYMVIMLYGQMVATNVATEKSSRAMELLITSANPVSLLFGKVLASCLAGLIQLGAIFGTAYVAFNLTRADWENDLMIKSIFDMPPALLGYMLLFFLLGFLIYAFLYGAIGSTASKLEDINTSVLPITFLFIAGFMVVIFGIINGDMNNTLMQVCSFIPFTSPMAMFARICMTKVAVHEIVISVGILAATTAAIGVLAAKIYRVGVLLYGNQPSLGAIFKAIRKS